MKKANLQRGFIPLIAIVIIAVVAVGGGAYYSKNKADKEKNNPNTEEKENGNEARGKGSIRALLSLGREAKCTVSSESTDGSKMSGVSYVAGSHMRGDFTMTSSAGTKTESHMIRSGNDVYVWSGTQGAKMNISDIESQSKGTATAQKANIDLNVDVDYECEDWTKTDETFAMPSGVNFVDMSVMMKNMQEKMDAKVKANVDVKVDTGVKVDY